LFQFFHRHKKPLISSRSIFESPAFSRRDFYLKKIKDK
jgi:hypothetical protein